MGIHSSMSCCQARIQGCPYTTLLKDFAFRESCFDSIKFLQALKGI
jgi:hypothetical protein